MVYQITDITSNRMRQVVVTDLLRHITADLRQKDILQKFNILNCVVVHVMIRNLHIYTTCNHVSVFRIN